MKKISLSQLNNFSTSEKATSSISIEPIQSLFLFRTKGII